MLADLHAGQRCTEVLHGCGLPEPYLMELANKGPGHTLR